MTSDTDRRAALKKLKFERAMMAAKKTSPSSVTTDDSDGAAKTVHLAYTAENIQKFLSAGKRKRPSDSSTSDASSQYETIASEYANRPVKRLRQSRSDSDSPAAAAAANRHSGKLGLRRPLAEIKRQRQGALPKSAGPVYRQPDGGRSKAAAKPSDVVDKKVKPSKPVDKQAENPLARLAAVKLVKTRKPTVAKSGAQRSDPQTSEPRNGKRSASEASLDEHSHRPALPAAADRPIKRLRLTMPKKEEQVAPLSPLAPASSSSSAALAHSPTLPLQKAEAPEESDSEPEWEPEVVEASRKVTKPTKEKGLATKVDKRPSQQRGLAVKTSGKPQQSARASKPRKTKPRNPFILG